MNDLRKAAEMALEALEHFNQGNSTAVVQGEFNDEIEALRQALDLQTAVERGTKAWADVPADWVDELRGNDTPEVTPDVDNAYTKLDTSDRVLHKTNVPQP